MYLTFQNIKRTVAGIAICWSLVLLLMHGKLLKQHTENEKKAADILTGNMLQIRCGERLAILRDRQCIKRFKYVIMHWIKSKCFGELGVTSIKDIDCSVYQYLVFVERVCPYPSNMEEFFSENLSSKEQVIEELYHPIKFVDNFTLLYARLIKCGNVCEWMKKRVNSMESKWLKTSSFYISNLLNRNVTQNTYSNEDFKNDFDIRAHTDYFTTKRTRLKILLHMGLLTKEYGLNFGEAAFSGGPLGELVQWSDLMAALHTLGHEVILSWSPERLKKVVVPNKSNYHACQPARTVDLIFTDLVGLEQLRESMGSLYHYRCLVRVLDVYGTDPQFNHPIYNPEKFSSKTWGGRGLNPAQFFTHFPHSPDNSFLGFVVEKHEEGDPMKRNRNCAVLYGKRSTLIAGGGKRKYLDKVYEFYEEVHATMWFKEMDTDDTEIPPYVINHKNMKQTDFIDLLRRSSLYVGLGWPVEGPAALEAIANGVVYLNPKFIPNRQVTTGKPTNRKLTSQNPYAEVQIGEPHVYTVDVRNIHEVEETLKRIEKQPSPGPHVPFEFTYLGFMERLDAYIENQDFCLETIRSKAGEKHIWKHERKRWPLPSLLQIKLGKAGESCSATCSGKGLVCEPSFFADINSIKSFRDVAQECSNSLEIHPEEDYHKHRGLNRPYKEFSVPCHAPSYDAGAKACLVQTDFLLFSCACEPPHGIIRLCPCREYKTEQIALYP